MNKLLFVIIFIWLLFLTLAFKITDDNIGKLAGGLMELKFNTVNMTY